MLPAAETRDGDELSPRFGSSTSVRYPVGEIPTMRSTASEFASHWRSKSINFHNDHKIWHRPHGREHLLIDFIATNSLSLDNIER